MSVPVYEATREKAPKLIAKKIDEAHELKAVVANMEAILNKLKKELQEELAKNGVVSAYSEDTGKGVTLVTTVPYSLTVADMYRAAEDMQLTDAQVETCLKVAVTAARDLIGQAQFDMRAKAGAERISLRFYEIAVD